MPSVFPLLQDMAKQKNGEMANIKIENSKTWSEEAIDTLINCFQSLEWIWNERSSLDF